ncbi:midasin isoform X2 [Nasonia vitripennis]|uniref:MYND-type domain-containing protein n=1 Tax=Nasonia vitripennis TaxID=7425 RepID=A0A7M7T7Z1_NASVI|nr:midasin isoform X2 [Nasonia vitripennis]
MAEDLGEAGQTALGSADKEKPTESRGTEEQPKQPEKPAEPVEPVKETHEDDDLESSQSLNLVLEDPEESEEQKPAADKASDPEEPELAGKPADADAGSSKVDDAEESKLLACEAEKTEKTDKTDKTEVQVLKSESQEAEKLAEDAKLGEDDVAFAAGEPETKRDDARANKESAVETEAREPEVATEGEDKKEAEGGKSGVEPEQEKADGDVAEIEAEDAKIKEALATAAESEVGIVGPPTAACDLLSDAELVAEKPSLPTGAAGAAGAQVSERVVRWVENTAAKADDPAVAAAAAAAGAQPEGDAEGETDGDDDNEEQEDEEELDGDEDCSGARRTRGRKRRPSNGTIGPPANRKSQKVVGSIIRRSIRCLNKMHAMDSSGGGNGKNALESGGPSELKQRDDEDSRKSPKVPQSQQNGAALPEETASADRNLVQCVAASGLPAKKEKKEPLDDAEANLHVQSPTRKSSKLQAEQPTTSPGKAGRPSGQRGAPAKLQLDEQQQQQPHCRETRKRRSAESAAAPASLSANGSGPPKKLCLDQREQFINSLIGSDKYTAEQLASRAEQLRAEVQELDELARAKEMEWNEILSMRKLKEEAYLRIERRRQIMGFMEGNGPLGAEGLMPPASLCLAQQHLDASNSQREPKLLVVPKEERSRDSSPAFKRERASKAQPSYLQPGRPQQLGENGPKMQQAVDAQSPEHRQIGEGRQGPIVDVRSIIADYRLRHPETVPRRRGRRMRNSVNVGLGAGGAMVETVGNMDSRPSSTDSCKSNSNLSDPNNAMSFKDVLVQFAKLSQQQDVTLHPVAATPTTQNSAPQTGSGSLLHGILTKSQSPRPTTFSPTLARLLTAPERERSAPAITPTPHQSAQHLLQAYQGANPVSISDFLSSSKARTEITITPVVNNPLPTHANNLIHVDDGEDETSIIEERDSRLPMGARDNADDRDSPPRCQGCHERAAQFVCAGCGNQWYCSRECQVAAWDDHSEVCSG